MLLLDAEGLGPRKPQDFAFAISATTLAATPAEATPNSTSAVLRASAGADHPSSLTLS